MRSQSTRACSSSSRPERSNSGPSTICSEPSSTSVDRLIAEEEGGGVEGGAALALTCLAQAAS
eukprot:7521207-Pyramimonas_sp.AAC.1